MKWTMKPLAEVANFCLGKMRMALLEESARLLYREWFVRLGENASTFLQRENLALQNQKLKVARDLLLPRLMRGEITV